MSVPVGPVSGHGARARAASPSSAVDSLSEQELAATDELLTADRVRLLPYPFASAVAIVSDIDGSSRHRYDGYVGMLVDKLGLDFGDSTWLRWQFKERGVGASASGFFSPNLTTGRGESAAIFSNTRTFNELVAEFHKGNVDHFHAFSSRGPRVVVIDQWTRQSGGTIEIEFGDFQHRGPWHCEDLFAFGVCVVGLPGKSFDVRAVTVIEQDGTITNDYRQAPWNPPPNGREHRLFTIAEPAEGTSRIPQLDRLSRVAIDFLDPEHADNIERVLLISDYGEMLLDRLRFLRDRYNVEMNLITEHAGLHFRNPAREPIADGRMREHVKVARGPIEAYNGRLIDDDGAVVFSTDADDPHSFCRVFPELSRDLEVRFIVPAAATNALGWSALELVTPSRPRSGGGVYWARRSLPNVDEPVGGRKFDQHSRHSTFPARVTRVIEHATRRPGLFWPIYTHLGGLERSGMDQSGLDHVTIADRIRRVPSPYFEPGPLNALQDCVFNIRGTVPSRSRIWVARATVLYDYALIRQRISQHVQIQDANTVLIESWIDPVLGKTLPRSPAQLYGLTFYVRDTAQAIVRLDGEPIETLVKNPRDETGRLSVTIAETDTRYVLFDRLDPLRNAAGEVRLGWGKWEDAGPVSDDRAGEALLHDAEWRWVEQSERGPFARLTVSDRRGIGGARRAARARLPLYGWTPTGAQLLSFAVNCDQGVLFGLLFETRSGGRFYFGDKTLARAWLKEEFSAAYFFHPHCHRLCGWQVLTVPFHDLAWAVNGAPGGPMPNHPLAALTILCAGKTGSGIDIGRVAFLRPRTAAAPQDSARQFCFGGSVPEFVGGQCVHAAAIDADDAPPLRAEVDQRGHFCFGRVPPGIYKVWSPAESGAVCDRRGPFVEVSSEVSNLVLDRRTEIGVSP